MPIVEPIIRPPSEADSFLLQVTTGCSANKCAFCAAYQGKDFSFKSGGEISADIRAQARLFPETRKVFLLDGDALAVPNEKLLPVLDELHARLPRISRISSYANGFNITGRSMPELKKLSARKLNLIYLGLESGSQKVLDRCRKRSTAEEMITAVVRAREAGIKSSVIVLLGLGGRRLQEEHILRTAEALNRMQPKFLSFLSLMLIPGTPFYEENRVGRFQELSGRELVAEAYEILSRIELSGTVFLSNHASNHLPLTGRLPQDKDKLLAQLAAAREGNLGLRPEFLRGL